MRVEVKETGRLAWTKPEVVESAIGSVTKTGPATVIDGLAACES